MFTPGHQCRRIGREQAQSNPSADHGFVPPIHPCITMLRLHFATQSNHVLSTSEI